MSTYKQFTRHEIDVALPVGEWRDGPVAGNEATLDHPLPDGWLIRCYTGLSVGADASRGCGEDAIRFVLIDAVSGKPVGKTIRVHRTGTVKSLAARFAERVAELEAVAAREQPLRCKRCGAATAERKNKGSGRTFRGCVNWRNCKAKGVNDVRVESNLTVPNPIHGDRPAQIGANEAGDRQRSQPDRNDSRLGAQHEGDSSSGRTIGAVQERSDRPDNGRGGSSLAAKLAASLSGAKRYTPTEEQAAIIAAAKAGHHVIVVQAGAGTGKTSTDVMIADELGGRGQYTAFNAPLCAEAKGKMPSHVAVNTIHSLAFRAEGHKYKHRLNTGRVKSEEVARRLGIEAMEANGKRLAPGYLAAQVLGAVRRFCNSADAEIAEKHFQYQDGLDQPGEGGQRTYDNNNRMRAYLLPFAQRAWADLSSATGTLPFTHDCYAKIWELNHPVISCDYLLIDEAQDLVGRDISIIRKQTCQVIIVGDSNQTIYAWRGCEDALAEFPDAPTLYLSQSFRFGQAIADVANAVLATLEEPTALRLKGLLSIESTVIQGHTASAGESDDESGRTKCDRPEETGMCVLTRTNACAVATLLNAMTEGKRPFLVGGGADVIMFVEAAKALKEGRGTSHPELACFGSWAEVEEYSKLDEGSDLKLMVKLIQEFGCEPILRALRSMPPEKDADLIISTAHKSKGREWDRVKLAADFKVKSKCDDAEKKLVYVAVTRAKLFLDVSACPFFTGQDSLDISKVVANERKQGERAESTRLLGDPGGRTERQHGGRTDSNDVHRRFPIGSPTQAPVGSGVPAGGAAVQAAQEADSKVNHEPLADVASPPRPGMAQQADSAQGSLPFDGADRSGNERRTPAASGAPSQFTWTRFRDAWMIRGPKGCQTGTKVTAHRKNGQISSERLGAVAWENGEAAIYRLLSK